MRTSLKALLFAALGLSLVQPVEAAIVAGSTVVIKEGLDGGYGGGAFWVTHPSNTADNYASFCVERDEYFSYGRSYTVTDINTAIAKNGGINIPNDAGDNISVGTAWIYSGYRGVGNAAWNSFATANSVDVTYDPWGRAIQAVIWRLEDEVYASETQTIADASSNSWWHFITGNSSTSAAKALILWNYVTAGTGGAGFSGVGGAKGDYTVASGNRVVVMNIKHPTTNVVAQSQLAYGDGDQLIPPPEVPEPATIAIWGLGLGIAGLVKFSRRRTKK